MFKVLYFKGFRFVDLIRILIIDYCGRVVVFDIEGYLIFICRFFCLGIWVVVIVMIFFKYFVNFFILISDLFLE